MTWVRRGMVWVWDRPRPRRAAPLDLFNPSADVRNGSRHTGVCIGCGDPCHRQALRCLTCAHLTQRHPSLGPLCAACGCLLAHAHEPCPSCAAALLEVTAA